MKISYFKWNSFGTEDIQEAFKKLGHELTTISYLQDDVQINEELLEKIIDSIRYTKADIAFSSNYFPPIAEACHEVGVPYVSWVYDSPHVMLYSYTTVYDTNRIFVFDRDQYEEFARNKINTVHYMPLAAAPERLMRTIRDPARQELFKKSRFYNETDIAFVGALYDEEHTFYRRLNNISDHTRGYLEAIISTQQQIWGYNFIRKMMKKEIMDDMSLDLPMQPKQDSVASREYLFAEYCINREITARERLSYITEIGERFYNKNVQNGYALDLYTSDGQLSLKGIKNHGPIDHYETAPFVYNSARININITLRSIHSGIPLRAFEILGSGGFLLSNYQADFDDCYVDGEDYVSFGSKDDMLEKIEYYRSHENERAEIAENGLRRTVEDHTYEKRLTEMLKYV